MISIFWPIHMLQVVPFPKMTHHLFLIFYKYIPQINIIYQPIF